MLLYNEHVPFGITDVVLRDTLSQHDFVLLARHESKTGYLSVLESKKEHFRVLRCDHSLLGGEWQQPPNGLEYTSRVKEPVYAVFVMLEAVRLVEVDESVAERGIPESDKTALVIGLGIGTTPSALVAHGINTTTVEIDPLVHEYAEHYFGLPLNHTTVIQDAMAFVEESNAKSTIHYDYIIHDVFTGGAEPIELFTHEFLLGLSSLLKPSGVIAINYAGDLTLPPAQIIILTIKTVFPNCRMFRENETPLSEDADFTNLVIICTKLPTPFSLRDPVEGDFLGSYARKHYLKPRYEVPSDFLDRKAIIGEDYSILRKENTKRLQEWQTKSAVGHWALMRIVLPDKVWEAW
ncbi:S-adenosyl-L-methionine-dependent methyltransferase [Xylona heveae TC161]|uniref:S-adenosyl-L-methionine-dependent methyltransferase n=1 Tax=Xylona heveae (strain CBS 132557 / TC161) TaxID=1328760 RepID=A0A165H4N0_XYLHT|nr:S-adenosyl-L-methionine-dependent methyltransferase [Xylona heveae TC161]KZF22979.1 S-adenosyl-L-methionine-dependent methyltransferase [Xylona heveae TC161]